MAKLQTSGYRAWWPMKQLVRTSAEGDRIYKEVFRNMETGEEHDSFDKDSQFLGWDGEPPPLEKGEKGVIADNQSRYTKNYSGINWG